MRRTVVLPLAMAIAFATPAWSKGKEGKKTSAAKTAASAVSAAAKGAAKSAGPIKPASADLTLELAQLQQTVQAESKQIEAQQKQIEALEQRVGLQTPAPSAVDSSGATTTSAAVETPVATPSPEARPATTQPAIATLASPGAAIAAPASNGQGAGTEPASPLQFRIGSAYVTPVGFMDLTGEWRSRDVGSGIGTNFGGIPYGDAIPANIGEFRLSMQNSRIGFRVDAKVEGAHVIGYMESDYLGVLPGNVAVSSNSNSLRSRLYWVDISKGKWEFLGGQSWSLITPGRSGISPLPGNIFFSQNMDTNYQAGLFWARNPELRVVYHPSSKVAFALAIDSPEQYIGGSAGGGLITLPQAASGYIGPELDNGGTTLSVGNSAPDIIAKLALDPSPHFHLEVGGVVRRFRLYNPVSTTSYSATGGAGFLNVGFDLFKGFRILTNNFWGDGGGRYIFGQAPDLIVRADGSPSLVHSGSTVSGFEWTVKHTLLFGYYGGIYISRNAEFDTNGKPIGYGYSGSPSSQNRSIQEGTFGLNQGIWSNPHYGALNFITQYSYLTRSPWSVPAGSPKNADVNMLFFDLRYTLPGSAPAMK